MGTLTAPKSGVSYAYAYASDAESGQSPRRFARRFLTRRVKVIASISTIVVLIIFLTSPPANPYSPVTPIKNPGKGYGLSGLTGIWDSSPVIDEGERKGWGWGFGSSRQSEETVEQGSDPIKDLKHTQNSYIAPLHPDIDRLPRPEEIIPDFNIPLSLRSPTFEPFPNTRLREVISPKIPREENDLPRLGKSQNNGMDLVLRFEESSGRVSQVVEIGGRVKRRDQLGKNVEMPSRELLGTLGKGTRIMRGVSLARPMTSIVLISGHDEVKPVSAKPSDPFNGWGASIIDTLDTLLVMGLSDEYNLCRPHVNQVNFEWVNGRDWAKGYVSEAPPTDDEETPSETWSVPRDKFIGLPVFETSIRYLGGLLGAYDLSGDQLLLDRAVELADIVGKAFNTDSGVPAGRIDPGATPSVYSLGSISIAEAGSMSLELIRLSQITGNRTWFDLAQRTMDFLEQEIIPKSTQTPLIPLYIHPNTPMQTIAGAFSFGGLADSYYEYLVKTYKLLGGSPVSQSWRRIYEESIDKAKEVLYSTIDYIPNTPLTVIGKLEGKRLIPEMEHLSCFAGAMLGIGSKLLDRPDDMEDALKITQTCYWLSAATKTGLQPEVVEFWSKGEEPFMEVETANGFYKKTEVPDGSNTFEDGEGNLRWNVDGGLVDVDEDEVELGGYEKKLKGALPGSKKVVGRGINRPETIESIFYM